MSYAVDDLAELREYLGDDYDERRMEHWDSAVEEEFEQLGDESALYRTSQGYLYDLTVFAMSGIKLPYLDLLQRHVPPGGRILDYGCGIGADGLRLLERGFDVAFADFDNPSTKFLRWRLERRGIDVRVYDVERNEIPTDFDATFAFDVIEHVDDPFAFVARMESLARLVAVNLLESLPEEAENPLHRDLPISELLARAAARAPFAYERHHKRSHLVLYGPGSAPAPVRALRLARLRAERLLAKPRGRAAQVS